MINFREFIEQMNEEKDSVVHSIKVNNKQIITLVKNGSKFDLLLNKEKVDSFNNEKDGIKNANEFAMTMEK